MNKLKKIAKISLIIALISTVVALVSVPWAIKESFNSYNSLLDENISIYDTTTFNNVITDIEMDFLDYGYCKVITSPDNQVHLKVYDRGFYKPEISTVITDNKVKITYKNRSMGKITEENIKKAVMSSFNNHYDMELQIPKTITLNANKPNWMDFYNNYDFTNGKQFKEEKFEKSNVNISVSEYNSLYSTYRSALMGLESLKADCGTYRGGLSNYFTSSANIYNDISRYRSDLIKIASALYYSDNVDNKVIANAQNLTILEQKRDYEMVKASQYYYDMADGNISMSIHNSLVDTSNATVAELNKQIAVLNDELETYLSNSVSVNMSVSSAPINDMPINLESSTETSDIVLDSSSMVSSTPN